MHEYNFVVYIYMGVHVPADYLCELWDVCLYIYSGLALMHLAIPVNLFSSVYLSKVIIQLFLQHFAARTLGALQNNNRSLSEHNTNTVLK